MRSIWSVGISFQRCRAGGGRTDPDAIDQHQRLAGIGAAQAEAGEFAEATGAGNIHAGLAGKQFGQATGPQALDVGARQDGDRGERVIDAFGGAGGGHDDHIVAIHGLRRVAASGSSSPQASSER